jgi:hypothetical protein
VKIISLIVAGLPVVVCFSVAVSFIDAAENAENPEHIGKKRRFPKG